MAQTYTHDSFGEQTASNGSLTNPFRYTSREFDSETGLYYYRARYYDPNTGRFLNEDPSRFAAGVDFYVYVDNNSTNLFDPSGLLQVCCRKADIGKTTTRVGLGPACHCFLKMSNGDTLGAYNFHGILYPSKNNGDDTHPKNQPKCDDVPGSECKVRQLFDAFPKLRVYGSGGVTSNSLPIWILNGAGINYTFPSCAWGLAPPVFTFLGSPPFPWI